MQSTPKIIRKQRFAFTLLELLVVIAIIGILAAILLPAVIGGTLKVKRTRAKHEAAMLAADISHYESIYNRYPVSSSGASSAMYAAVNPPDGKGAGDFTYGTAGASGANFQLLAVDRSGNQLAYQANNSEVIAILMDLENFGNQARTLNYGHVKNTQQTSLLEARMSGDTSSPGVGLDGVYRDPWGQPYLITVDLNNDNKARDALYAKASVSEMAGPTGYNGLYNPANSSEDLFELSSPVMVWSAGQDRKIDPAVAANQGANKDNILSWRQ